MSTGVETITDAEFGRFRKLAYEVAGINLTPAKKALVCGRLSRRLREFQLDSYGEYFDLLVSDRVPGELQTAIDLLTTNETYFFREPKHFDFLREKVLAGWPPSRAFRVWSAACSSGEEPYTLAMVLADTLGDKGWEVFGSDISSRVLDKARAGEYPMVRTKDIPERLLKRHCLKGVRSKDGSFAIDPELRKRVTFAQINLNAPLPDVGSFDVIFLRNVMIYFDLPMKQQVIARLIPVLRPGGYLIVSHSESLNGVTDALKARAPSIYQKP